MSFEVAVERAGLGYELVCRGRRRVLGALPEVGARYDAACDTGVEETRDRLLVEIGRELFAWLDGVDGWLRGWVAEDDPAPVLRLDLHAAGAGFGKAPWELLHDGVSFLASRGMVVARVVSSRKSPLVRANRYLEILFVAMAPEDGGPSLSYEAEEVAILQAAATQPVGLLVEETGSLSGVRDAVLSLPDARRLDVLHFTGHGAMEDGTPYLVAESEFGEADWVSADRLGKALEGVWPRIVFLSTCHSAERGTAPALGEEMVRLGAELSVGFAHPVYDRTGITAATAFYGELAAGRGPEQAARRAMGRMLEEGCPDWHLLRVFAEAGYGGPLVTTLRTPGRVAYRRPAAEMEYLDADQRMRIAGSAFVGRRQAMQRCWRVMQVASELRAIYLWGMGGLGKSSLAGRLVRRAQERNPKLRQVVVFGAFGEAGLRSRLADRYADRPRVLAALNDGLALAGQLRNFFQVVEEAGEPAVIVLDDFEQNMPGHRDGDLRVEPGAYRLLLDLLEAVRVDGNWSRVIVTCRYGMANLGWHEEALERMPEAEARKVVAGVERAEEVDQASAEGKARQLGREAAVLSAADGNPRLLAWLGRLPEDETFTELVSAKREEFREDIFAQQLLASLTEEELEAVARICWFNEPVEVAVVVGMGASEERLGRAVELGLVEFTKDGMYRVPEVLRGLLEELFVGEVKGWKEMAARVAFEFWTNEPFRMGRAEELFRLGLNAGVREVGIVAGTLIGNELTHQLRFQEVLRLHERFNFVFGVHYRFDLLAGRAGTFLGHPDALEWLDRAAKNIPTDRQDDKQEVLSHTVVLLRLLGKDELARQMACGIYEGGISSQMVQLLGADRLQLRGSTAEARRTYDPKSGSRLSPPSCILAEDVETGRDVGRQSRDGDSPCG